MNKALQFLLFSLFLTLTANARTIVLNSKSKTIDNKNCDLSDSCGLKSFSIKVDDTKVTVHGKTSYATRALISYKTRSVSNLEDFGIVQFIKGCQFNSTKSGKLYIGGVVERFFDEKYYPFHFKGWSTDSLDRDPLYNSWVPKKAGQSRHALYRWSKNGPSFNPKKDTYFYKGTPKVSELYVTDRPAIANYDSESGIAKNVSLKFKACVFDMKKVDPVMENYDLTPEDAIGCLDWEVSNIYDHKKGKFTKSQDIHPFCE